MISALTHQGLACCHQQGEGCRDPGCQDCPCWGRYGLWAGLSATTFDKQARSLLDTLAEHLRESVTRSPLSHIRGWRATTSRGRDGVTQPRACLVEEDRFDPAS
jgi:hypothetical protein